MKLDVIRAWKDALYRHSLSSEELATLPACPAGDFELSDADLQAVQGSWGLEHECCEREECERTNMTGVGALGCISVGGACGNGVSAITVTPA